jgi:pimeloyl-ACP methyl ester carboxylesterase
LAHPVLILTGEHDRLFRIDADVNELKGRIPDAEEKRYSDAGHLIPLEDPDGFTNDLLGFARRCATVG